MDIAKAAEAYEGASPKETLMLLQRDGHLSGSAVRTLAPLLDEMVAKGTKDPISKLLRQYDQGKIEVVEEGPWQGRFPTIEEVPIGLSEKQTLLWLHQHGSLSMLEVQEAAAAVNGGADARAAIEKIGAVRALPKKAEAPKPAETPPRTPQPPSEGVGELDEGGEGEGGPEVEINEEEANLLDNLHALTGDQIADLLPSVASILVLEELHEIERENPKYDGGRSTVFDAIEQRRGELEVDKPNPGISAP